MSVIKQIERKKDNLTVIDQIIVFRLGFNPTEIKREMKNVMQK